MKKKTLRALFTAALAVCVMLSACGEKSSGETAEPTEEPTDTYVSERLVTSDEPEHAPVDCELELRDATRVLAAKEDFESFFITGSDSEKLAFTLSEEAFAGLDADVIADCYLTLDGKNIGAVSLDTGDADSRVVVLERDMDHDELWELAITIRGLGE